jgi:hypothetical protein
MTLGAGTLLVLAYLTLRQMRHHHFSDLSERTALAAARLGLVPKLKLLLGYYQVVLAMPG